MHRETCPYCRRPLDVADADAGLLVRCDKVGCTRFFISHPNPCAPGPPAPANSGRSVPEVDLSYLRLTGPHRCHACPGEINQPLGRRRCTVIHRSADPALTSTGQGNCRMDVYAAIYYCPTCTPGTLLETPYHQWGTDIVCPVCQTAFRAPRDDILHERAADAREGVPFRFSCPSCQRELRCDTLRQGRLLAGQWVVCLHCRHRIQVPQGGDPVSRDPSEG